MTTVTHRAREVAKDKAALVANAPGVANEWDGDAHLRFMRQVTELGSLDRLRPAKRTISATTRIKCW